MPLRCGARTYRAGERIPFTITLTITAAAPVADVLLATTVHATYASDTRINLTPCVLPPRVEGAKYTGTAIPT